MCSFINAFWVFCVKQGLTGKQWCTVLNDEDGEALL